MVARRNQNHETTKSTKASVQRGCPTLGAGRRTPTRHHTHEAAHAGFERHRTTSFDSRNPRQNRSGQPRSPRRCSAQTLAECRSSRETVVVDDRRRLAGRPEVHQHPHPDDPGMAGSQPAPAGREGPHCAAQYRIGRGPAADLRDRGEGEVRRAEETRRPGDG